MPHHQPVEALALGEQGVVEQEGTVLLEEPLPAGRPEREVAHPAARPEVGMEPHAQPELARARAGLTHRLVGLLVGAARCARDDLGTPRRRQVAERG